MRRKLLESGVSEEAVSSIEEEVKKTVADSIEFALSSDYPKKESLYTDLYAS